ncbi:hypothetical protein [Salipaludibacillus aurantiacus]|uniref:hypothetical protein n=1 Tax=Salipaludibacillus aurantiacus TaxID=1601833 RepID=UPI0015A615C4|nr:hypothetical protein [Salipaludibacillus aurantiacus]
MEKAMFQSYGIGYAEYNRDLDNRMKVEQERDKDHQQSLKMVNEHNRQLQYSI